MLSLLDELHCWSLVESESFLWLVSQSGVGSVPTNHSVQLRPTRCSRDTLYIFNRASGQPLAGHSGSKCFYFVSETVSGTTDTNWAQCTSCEQCDENFFFKVEELQTPKFEFNLLTISIVISLSIMTLLGAILFVAR